MCGTAARRSGAADRCSLVPWDVLGGAEAQERPVGAMRAVWRAVLVFTDLGLELVVNVLVSDRRVLSGNGLHRQAVTSPEIPAVGRAPL